MIFSFARRTGKKYQVLDGRRPDRHFDREAMMSRSCLGGMV
jgi:hypothetical protein